VPRPDPADLALIDAEAERFDLARHAADLGAARLTREAPARELLAEWMFACTLNIDALSAGRIEAGPGGDDAATVIPRMARCFADLRVVPGVAPDEVLRLLRAHLDRRGFRHVQVKLRSSYPASRAITGTPVVRALIDACREHSADLHVWPIHAGAAPMHVFSDVIGIPYAFGGVGHGGGAHGPDEYILVDDIAPFMRSIATFLFRFGAAQNENRGRMQCSSR
jgi:acetylornithine deacetylase/succinyl-diaminopimelate desuccinylase-like protein